MAVLEVEIDQLRKEVGGLRAEILMLRETVQRAAVKPVPEKPRQPSVTELIAPQYSEAMQLAKKSSIPAQFRSSVVSPVLKPNWWQRWFEIAIIKSGILLRKSTWRRAQKPNRQQSFRYQAEADLADGGRRSDDCRLAWRFGSF